MTLGKICSLITDGKHGDCRDQDDSGFFFISAKDIRDGRVNYLGAREITQSDFEETHRRTDLCEGDVLVTNSGTIGRIAIAEADDRTACTTFQKSVAVLKPIRELVDPRFLYYALVDSRERLVNASAGAAQKNLLLGELRRFSITLPSVDEQMSIAEKLRVYDALVTNNERRMALLERATRLLFDEWFVRFASQARPGRAPQNASDASERLCRHRP
ncbi:restriction endonuclease subunit S [Terricaulis silvestris]|uniref:restriction endonuclease subunit S n=1 Tax=Terricaulis silvestris TaxID=2686094 RepID=UPI00131AA89C|nr:restriction endonuclease subunit S [Terricaulis silvestris]